MKLKIESEFCDYCERMIDKRTKHIKVFLKHYVGFVGFETWREFCSETCAAKYLLKEDNGKRGKLICRNCGSEVSEV
jgi:hypothetical protein